MTTARVPRRPRGWRWLRLAVPVATAVLLLIVTGVMHAIESPSVTDTDYLNPASSAPFGGARLHDLLASRGVPVERFTSTHDALAAAYRSGGATLFVPAPGLAQPYYLRDIDLLPADTRVVLVAPSLLTLSNNGITVSDAASRWATRAAAPGCELPEAVSAGQAAVYRTHYGSAGRQQLARCYGGALVDLRSSAAEVLLVGASDPFRNDRIGEYGNAALATGLLAAHSRVIWLDLHRNEPPPPPPPGGRSPGQAGSPDPDQPSGDGQGARQDNGRQGGGQGSGNQRSSGQHTPNPLWQAFPPWSWAALALLALAAVVMALARARRLGPPVPEPLAVAVRATETVEGRGRLYRRARARGPALDALRAAALHRILPALDLEPDAAPSTVVSAVAHRTGRDQDEVDAVLYGPPPTGDDALVHAAAALDALLHHTLTDVHKGESG